MSLDELTATEQAAEGDRISLQQLKDLQKELVGRNVALEKRVDKLEENVNSLLAVMLPDSVQARSIPRTSAPHQ